MKTLRFIGLVLILLLIITGIYTAFLNDRSDRNVAMGYNERVTIERIYSYDSKTVYLVTVDGVEYLYFRAPYAAGFTKK